MFGYESLVNCVNSPTYRDHLQRDSHEGNAGLGYSEDGIAQAYLLQEPVLLSGTQK
jgi:hypothetical protein